MKFIKYVIISLSIITGCMQQQKYAISPAEKAVNRITGRNARIIGKKFNIHPNGIGVSMPEGDIRSFGLHFQIYVKDPMPKEKVRAILIGAANDFLADINGDAELCSYLKHHQMSLNDIEIVLFIDNVDPKRKYDLGIGIASFRRGLLRYDVMTTGAYCEIAKRELLEYESTTTETYEEALQLLNDPPSQLSQ